MNVVGQRNAVTAFGSGVDDAVKKLVWDDDAATLGIAYGSGLDAALSRPLALEESSTTIASMRYLGYAVPIGLKYDAASTGQQCKT